MKKKLSKSMSNRPNSSEISLQDLMDDLKYVQKLRDGRIMILKFHLYLEHFINEIAKEKGVVSRNIIDKSKTLSNQKVIDNEIHKLLKLINKIRNKLVHTLKPNGHQLDQWIKNFKPKLSVSDPEFTKALNIPDVFGRIQLYSVPAIANLYTILKQIRKEEIKEDMRMILKDNGKEYIWMFELSKRK